MNFLGKYNFKRFFQLMRRKNIDFENFRKYHSEGSSINLSQAACSIIEIFQSYSYLENEKKCFRNQKNKNKTWKFVA